MIKSVFKIILIFVVGVIGGIFADQILWPYFIERPLFFEYRLDRAPVYITEEKEIFIQENTALQNAVEKVEKVVVGMGYSFKGSGIIVTSDGLIVTLSDFLPVGSVYFDGKEYIPEVVKTENGLVLLKIKENNLPTVSFADMGEVRLGQRMFLVGALLDPDLKKKVNEGIIKYSDEDALYTNIYEEKSLAGSASFTIDGSLLGMNILNARGEIQIIPISEIKKLLEF